MAKRPSWADRRWKLFEQAYSENPAFRSELDGIFKTTSDENELFKAIIYSLQMYKVPHWCVNAVIAFMQNSKLKRDKYLKLILPPFTYWSMSSDIIGPNNKSKASTVFSKRFASLKMKLLQDDVEIDPSKVASVISGGHVMLQLSPYTNKTELKELIDEFWGDLEPMLLTIDGSIDPTVGLNLRGKVYEVDAENRIARDKLILKLSEDGETDLYIQTRLQIAGFSLISLENIRTIRYRLKQKNRE